MHPFERAAVRLRHLPWPGSLEWFWNLVRPVYNRVIGVVGARGLRRNINGTDRILVLPEKRLVSENYEPHVWRLVMDLVRPGDVIADVGAHHGLFTIALAKRVGPGGKVHAFEPERGNAAILRRQIALNGTTDNTVVREVAASRENGEVPFASNSEQSGIVTGDGRAYMVPCAQLDSIFPVERLDLLKIDVEGFEEWVLQGAHRLLRDPARRPRAIFIEVHPFAWNRAGTTSESLLDLLRSAGYVPREIEGHEATSLTAYGHIYADPATS